MFELFKKSGIPNEAQGDWERFQAEYFSVTGKNFNPSEEHPLLRLFGNSRFLTRLLFRYPKLADRLEKDPFLTTPKSEDQFRQEANSILSIPTSNLDQLKLYKYYEFLRITLKDLTSHPDAIILSELSGLAYGLLQAINQFTYQESVQRWGKPLSAHGGHECGYHLLALGKLGGEELNYSSDIDLLAITETDDGQAGSLSLHEFFVRHTQHLTQNLQLADSNGFFYRVDWDLRPEGKAGTLVNSLAALEGYYEVFGADWERQAFTKARLGCGSEAVGKHFLKMMAPFVYRKYMDIDSIQRTQLMRQKIHENHKKQEGKGYNVKLGVGGIREIEFFVQAFLLLYGGRKPELRTRSTLDALDRLTQAKLVNESTATTLRRSYLFLRRLEHRLQMVDEAQTHTIPVDPKEQICLARRMGYYQDSDKDALISFQSDLNDVISFVHGVFESQFSEKAMVTTIPGKVLHTQEAPLHAHRSALREQLDKDASFETKLDTIRFYKKNELKKILELEENPKASRQDILLKLTVLAEAISQEALALAHQELERTYGVARYHQTDKLMDQSHLLVLGMGKFGGYELNYASDLDVIFIFTEPGSTSGPKEISNSEYFARLVQKYITILSVPTRAGIAYQIDAELRPSGHAGPLVTSMEAFIDYQKEASQIWERQALLKARPVSGPPHLSRILTGYIENLLYSTPYPRGIKDEMHRLRMRVEKEKAKEGKYYFDIKLGKGGIMDIEFILQYLQLRFAAAHPVLRTTNTFEGIDALIQLNLLPAVQDGPLLKEAYTFYRTFEAKISLRMSRGLHRLSRTDEIIGKVAGDMGHPTVDQLLDQYHIVSNEVRQIYLKVFD